MEFDFDAWVKLGEDSRPHRLALGKGRGRVHGGHAHPRHR